MGKLVGSTSASGEPSTQQVDSNLEFKKQRGKHGVAQGSTARQQVALSASSTDIGDEENDICGLESGVPLTSLPSLRPEVDGTREDDISTHQSSDVRSFLRPRPSRGQSQSANYSCAQLQPQGTNRPPRANEETLYNRSYGLLQHTRNGVPSSAGTDHGIFGRPEGVQRSRSAISLPATAHTRYGLSRPLTPSLRAEWDDVGNQSDTTLTTLVSGERFGPELHDSHEMDKTAPSQQEKLFFETTIEQQGGSHVVRIDLPDPAVRQEYIIQLCRVLMLYGAPTHRLEEYLHSTAMFLEIKAQFLYIPCCMLITFDQDTTQMGNVRIVREDEGINLGKLADIDEIHKDLNQSVISVDVGVERLNAVLTAKEELGPWLRVLFYGLTSVTVAPFSFHARFIDLPCCFTLGCLVGWLKLIAAPNSRAYRNVYEVTATVVVSFLARLLANIWGDGTLCFTAMAQSGIAMLLPGYLVLSSSLELQSRAIVPGSIRIVYAIIYSLLLGFGINMGSTIFELIWTNTTVSDTCIDPMPVKYFILSVPLFNICISVLYQARWNQIPIMVLISCAGYAALSNLDRWITAAPQISITVGAFTVGLLANVWSGYSDTPTAPLLIPGIFTQVPGSMAATGGLLSGINTAQLLKEKVDRTDVTMAALTHHFDDKVFQLSGVMVQVAIGITVGLFLSTLVSRLVGKPKSALFNF